MVTYYVRQILISVMAGLIIVLGMTIVGCSKSGTASTNRASAIASSTALRADEQAAAKLVQSCLTAAHIAAAKGCIEAKVPVAKRAALKQCLVRDVAAIPGVHATAAKLAFEQGAQACVVTALS